MNIYIPAAFLTAGSLTGLLMKKVTAEAIKKRGDEKTGGFPFNGGFVWPAAFALLFFGAYLYFGISIKSAEFIFASTAAIMIAAVDYSIRRIPNGTLLSLILGFAAFFSLGGSLSGLSSHLAGLAAGLGIFTAPFAVGQRAGAGDIKYGAVIGLFLGYYYGIIAFFITAALFFVYASALFVTKKGGLKTKTALGPYMSAGFMVALVLSLA
ncbi:MAG: prepilin peptidase [Bacillota bacterium]|nr:prepilin peptidase [Bacillota bacterium]